MTILLALMAGYWSANGIPHYLTMNCLLSSYTGFAMVKPYRSTALFTCPDPIAIGAVLRDAVTAG